VPSVLSCIALSACAALCCLLSTSVLCVSSADGFTIDMCNSRPVCVQGGSILPVYSTDGEHLFRQEPYFHYLFGVNEDDCWGALDVRNVSKQDVY
jgi:hypothetical protein